MKITEITPFALDLPLRTASASYAGRVRTSLPMLLVRVRTDAGLTGWGEAFAFNLRSATWAALKDEVIPRCLGQDSGRITALAEGIRRALRNSKAGPLGWAIAAVEVALWDIAGKAAGLPLSRLLGGAAGEAVPVYASLVRFGEPAVAAARAAQALDEDYRAVKLHELEWEPIAEVRRAVGETTPLMLDISSAWSVGHAVAMARRLADLRPLWLEEPTWPPEDVAALARVAREGGLPLAAGENATSVSDLRLLCEQAGLSWLQPSLLKLGGIGPMAKALALAEAFNLPAAPHCYYLGPGLLATLHLAATAGGETLVEHAVFDLEARPYDGALALRDGALPLPDGPGLGLDPDPALLTRYAAG